MLAFQVLAIAALVTPAPGIPAPRIDCQIDRLRHVSADDRAIARFTAATHDYVTQGRHGAIVNDEAAGVFRFSLRLSRWLHRYHATETIAEGARAAGRRTGDLAAHGVVEAALPELPDELAYRLHGGHLLVVDRRTQAVVDLLPHAFGERW